jgi:hypothetical protein
MAARKVKELAVKVREYQNNQGETKAVWKNVGSMMKTDDGGFFLILDRTFNPAGLPNPENRDTFMVSVFDVKDDNQQAPQQQRQAPAPQQHTGFSDDIPFS